MNTDIERALLSEHGKKFAAFFDILYERNLLDYSDDCNDDNDMRAEYVQNPAATLSYVLEKDLPVGYFSLMCRPAVTFDDINSHPELPWDWVFFGNREDFTPENLFSDALLKFWNTPGDCEGTSFNKSRVLCAFYSGKLPDEWRGEGEKTFIIDALLRGAHEEKDWAILTLTKLVTSIQDVFLPPDAVPYGSKTNWIQTHWDNDPKGIIGASPGSGCDDLPKILFVWEELSKRLPLRDILDYPDWDWIWSDVIKHHQMSLSEILSNRYIELSLDVIQHINQYVVKTFEEMLQHPQLVRKWVWVCSNKNITFDDILAHLDIIITYGREEARIRISDAGTVTLDDLRGYPIDPRLYGYVDVRNVTMSDILANCSNGERWDWVSISMRAKITPYDVLANRHFPWNFDELSFNPNILIDDVLATLDLLPWDYLHLIANRFSADKEKIRLSLITGELESTLFAISTLKESGEYPLATLMLRQVVRLQTIHDLKKRGFDKEISHLCYVT